MQGKLAADYHQRTTNKVMLAISLMRMGAKKRPFYRVVVKEKRSKRDGSYLENLGTYDPLADPADVRLNHERIQYWIGVGAKPSETVASLIKNNPVMTEEERAAAIQARAEKKAAAEAARAEARRLEAEKREAERLAAEQAQAEAASAEEAPASEAESEASVVENSAPEAVAAAEAEPQPAEAQPEPTTPEPDSEQPQA